MLHVAPCVLYCYQPAVSRMKECCVGCCPEEIKSRAHPSKQSQRPELCRHRPFPPHSCLASPRVMGAPHMEMLTGQSSTQLAALAMAPPPVDLQRSRAKVGAHPPDAQWHPPARHSEQHHCHLAILWQCPAGRRSWVQRGMQRGSKAVACCTAQGNAARFSRRARGSTMQSCWLTHLDVACMYPRNRHANPVHGLMTPNQESNIDRSDDVHAQGHTAAHQLAPHNLYCLAAGVVSVCTCHAFAPVQCCC
jgi:hypothetical protein